MSEYSGFFIVVSFASNTYLPVCFDFGENNRYSCCVVLWNVGPFISNFFQGITPDSIGENPAGLNKLLGSIKPFLTISQVCLVVCFLLPFGFDNKVSKNIHSLRLDCHIWDIQIYILLLFLVPGGINIREKHFLGL